MISKLYEKYDSYFTGHLSDELSIQGYNHRSQASNLILYSNIFAVLISINICLSMFEGIPISFFNLLAGLSGIFIYPILIPLLTRYTNTKVAFNAFVLINLFSGTLIGYFEPVLSFSMTIIIFIITIMYGLSIGLDKSFCFHILGCFSSNRFLVREAKFHFSRSQPDLAMMMSSYSNIMTTMFLYILICLYFHAMSRKKIENQFKEVVRKLELAIESKDAFFASISQELRNPLNSLLGCVDLLTEKCTNDDKEMLEMASTFGEILLNLIENALDVSKLRAGFIEIKNTGGNITDTITNVHKVFKLSAKSKGVHLDLMFENMAPLYIETDHTRLTQVLINIVGNAIKFTDDGIVNIHVRWCQAKKNFIEKITCDTNPELFEPHKDYANMLKDGYFKRIHFEDSDDVFSLSKLELSQYISQNINNTSKSYINMNESIGLIKKGDSRSVIQYENVILPEEEKKEKKERKTSTLSSKGSSSLELYQFTRVNSPAIKKSKFRASCIDTKNKLESEYIRGHPGDKMISDSSTSLDNVNKINSKVQGYLKIHIVDTGIGISDDSMTALFKPFSQTETSISRNLGGPGLGLWISKSILNSMNADIKIYSKKDTGTDFLIVLPLKAGGEAIKENERIASFNNTSLKLIKKLQIMVVDDQRYNLKIMKDLLERSNFDVLTAENGVQALIFLKSMGYSYFDLIITDLNMPEMNGRTLIKEVKQLMQESKIHNRLKIVVLTSNQKEEEVAKSSKLFGADYLLVKPFRLKIFMWLAEQWFSSAAKFDDSRTQQLFAIPNQKILIVDSDTFTANLTKTMLINYGYKCFVVEDVEKAHDLMVQNYEEYFMLIIDVNVSNMSGYKIAEFVRRMENNRRQGERIYLICVSAVSGSEHIAMCKSVGFNEILVKPVKPAVIHSLVQDIVKKNS